MIRIFISSGSTVTLKIFFQELCKSWIGWDDPLPHELELKWKGKSFKVKSC